MRMTAWLVGMRDAGIVVAALVCFGCSESGTGGDDVEPPPAPAAVSDLQIASTGPGSVTLEWTAPVSDEQHGPVDHYDVRYTDFEPDASSWDVATQADGEPSPAPGGLTQTMTVTGLTAGTTYYFALRSCGEASCSDISNMAEALLPVEFEVTFPDAALEATIRSVLGQPSGPILYSALLTIHDVTVQETGIRDLSGLEHCDHLWFLMLLGNPIEDFGPIAGLHELRMLNLIQTGISDVSILSGLTTLEQLHLGNDAVTDINPLAALTNLALFNIHNNSVSDIGALAGMTKLTAVDLSGNAITDIGPLVSNAGIGDGDEIDVSNNPLSTESLNTHIPALQARGVTVHY